MTKKALITWGGWRGHEPEQCSVVAKDLLIAEGYEVEFVNTLEPLADEVLMQSLDLIVPCWTMDKLESEQSKGLVTAVKNGTGLAGWHGGMGDAFRADTSFQFMVGGQFVAHPGGIHEYEVNIVKSDDPIVTGINNFKVTSEQYYMHVDPGNEVLANTTFSVEGFDWVEGTVMPVVWKRKYGQGKVFYSALGHVAEEFEKFGEMKEILRRGMLWASR